MRKKSIFLLLFSLFTVGNLKAQPNIRDSIVPLLIPGVNYSFSIPGGDLFKRFGNFSRIGLDVEFKTKKNYLLGAEWSFLFGSNVKERSILDQIATRDSQIINSSGQFAKIFLFQRGMSFTAIGGKILPIIGPNKNSGIVLKGGLGYLFHKIRIESQNDNVPQIQGDYLKGYDRLTGGFLTYEFIGYQNFSNNRLVNYFVGFEFGQGYTQSLRDYNFDTMSQDLTKRIDFFYGIKVSWMIPIYKKAPKQFYTN